MSAWMLEVNRIVPLKLKPGSEILRKEFPISLSILTREMQIVEDSLGLSSQVVEGRSLMR
jgi:hypothetical protein